ncbi:MAG: hydrogenase maturation protease [Acidobacteriota bacterium]|nr:MAG: hydrogenase maturation protease [Acidobacteriota bacterium]
MAQPRTVVMGAGNILLKDEGVGIHVIRALKKDGALPPNVEVVDCGTAALDALQSLADVDKLIVVDAVRGGDEPGAIYRFSPEDIFEKRSESLSLHQLGLLEALKMAGMLGTVPKEIVIVGIQPEDVSPGLEPSPEIKRRIPEAVEVIKRLIQTEQGECKDGVLKRRKGRHVARV